MNKKNVQAFTLMELLAVLVILAIIALIVFPIIGDVITDSKMKAFKSSVDGLEHAVDLDYQKDYYTGEREYSYENGNLVLNSVKGESKNKNIKVEGIIENGTGTISVDKDGNTSLMIYNDEYCAVKDYSDKTITIEDKTERNCIISTPAYCFGTEEITVADSYDINLENCKTFMINNKSYWYEDETDQNAFCTKGQTASDDDSLEIHITSGYGFGVTTLANNQVIENVTMSNGLTITEYKCHEGNDYGYETITDVVIPTKINGIDVFEIEQNVFDGQDLTSVILPNNLLRINFSSFAYNNLETIFIPSSVKFIGPLAFNCNSLSKSDVTYEDPNNLPLVSDKVFGCEPE